MKVRNPQLESYEKKFKAAKSLADRIAIAKQAAADPGFSPCLPASMDYDFAKHDNKGLGVLAVDVDDVLLGEAADKTLLNDEYMKACHKAGYREIYLVTNMSFKVTDPFNRVDLIAYLALSGIRVCGMVTEADAVKEAKLGDFYVDYYQALINGKKSGDEFIKQGARKKEAEAMNDSYLEEQGKDPLGFGKKLMITRKIFSENPDIKKLIFADDSIVNLNGVTLDYITKPYHDAVFCTLPIIKMGSEINDPTKEKNYRKMLSQFDKGRLESDLAYKERMLILLFQAYLINLDQKTFNGTQKMSEFEGFRQALEVVSGDFNKKNVDVVAILDKVYSALKRDYGSYSENLSSAKPPTVAQKIRLEKFRDIEGVLFVWLKALAPKVSLPAAVISESVNERLQLKAPVSVASNEASLFSKSRENKGSQKEDTKPSRKLT